MSKSKRRLGHFSRRTRFESLEERIVLDTQIGTVTMPYTGYLSAGIFDSNGQLVRTLLAQTPESAGTVTLTWDGKDDYNRTVIDNGTYTWKALSSQLNVVDQGGIGDSYKAVEARLLAAIHLRFGLPAVLPGELLALIKASDRCAAYLEATRLAGFSASEARRFFGAPPKFSAVFERDYLVPWPAETAERRYLDRFAKLAPA